MAMAAVIHKKGVPENFVWEETKVGAPERGQVRLRSTAVGVNFADTYHRAVRFDNFVKYDCKIKEGAVADTVLVEPVSTVKFPANREKNREFFDLRSRFSA